MTPGPAAERARAEDEARALLAKARSENFPVAPRFLPGAWREDLMAIYGYARLVDDIGDGDLPHRRTHAALLGPGTRATPLILLDAFDADLRRVFAGAQGGTPPRHPLLRDLIPTVRRHGLDPRPFTDLIEANRLDQRRHRYADEGQLRGYCELSANPVGRLVLAVTGTSTPRRLRWSDAVCTALQLIEHLQDVAEDLARGRIYLPAADMRRFRVVEADLGAPTAGASVRTLVAFLTERARRLLDEGAPLVGSVRGRLRLLLAGYVGGGRAAAQAIADAGYDVLAGPPRPTRRGLLRATATTLGSAGPGETVRRGT